LHVDGTLTVKLRGPLETVIVTVEQPDHLEQYSEGNDNQGS